MSSNHFAYRKVRNLQIGVDMLLGKVSINLLHHTKSLFIIHGPAVACAYIIVGTCWDYGSAGINEAVQVQSTKTNY